MRKIIGYIGLGKMGHGMTERLLEHGWKVIATDNSTDAIENIKSTGAQGVNSMGELVAALPTPRLIWLMVPHTAVDKVLTELVPLLDANDIVVDGGNSNFNETLKRADNLAQKGIRFMDAGISGGPCGARDGACVMVGGERELFDEYEALFSDSAAPNAYAHMGKSGAGHFVKMVHNGIEYGMMQAIGEGMEVLKKSPFELDLSAVARIYNNRSVIESRLTEWLKKAYDEHGTELTDTSGEVSASGEGLWTVEAAKKLGVPAQVIEDALRFREQSKGNPSYTGQVVSALRNQFGGHDVGV